VPPEQLLASFFHSVTYSAVSLFPTPGVVAFVRLSRIFHAGNEAVNSGRATHINSHSSSLTPPRGLRQCGFIMLSIGAVRSKNVKNMILYVMMVCLTSSFGES
jgi:hypothetical protein